jgi:hypothetical protein
MDIEEFGAALTAPEISTHPNDFYEQRFRTQLAGPGAAPEGTRLAPELPHHNDSFVDGMEVQPFDDSPIGLALDSAPQHFKATQDVLADRERGQEHQVEFARSSFASRRGANSYIVRKPLKLVWEKRTVPRIRAWVDTPSQHSVLLGEELEPQRPNAEGKFFSATGDLAAQSMIVADFFSCGCLKFHHRGGMLILKSTFETPLELPSGSTLRVWFAS